MESSGSKGIGSILHEANIFIFEKNKKVTGIVGAILILILTVSVFSWEASSKDNVNGRDDILKIISMIRGGGGTFVDIPGIEGFEAMTEITTAKGDASVGTPNDISITATEEKVIRSINVTLTWSDESDIRRLRLYENQPDTFSVSIIDPEGKVLKEKSGSNPRNGEGRIDIPFQMDDETMISYKDAGDFTVEVTLTESGNYEPRLGGSVLVINDGANSFDLVVEVRSYEKPTE
jgi:hypothetical protein